MPGETALRAAFWVLLADVLLIRVYVALQLRRAGERYLPDQPAVERAPKKRGQAAGGCSPSESGWG